MLHLSDLLCIVLARTNVVVDTDLLDEACQLTGLKTKKDVINNEEGGYTESKSDDQ